MSQRARDARHTGLASALSGLSPAQATGRLLEQDLFLDWAPVIESMPAGQAIVRTTANLIVRFCPSLRIVPNTELAAVVAQVMRDIDSSAEPDRTPRPNALRIHLGGGSRGDVTGSASGWIASVSGFGDELPPLGEVAPAIGAHAAAALVASQVFAKALPLDPRLAGPSPLTQFSTFDYLADGTNPVLAGPPTLAPSLLAGVGAVGQAFIDTLVGIDARGNVAAVDFGRVDDPTNLNRSVLALERDLVGEALKVELAVRRASASGVDIEPLAAPLVHVIAEIENGSRTLPGIVLSALDNRPARWELQSLWPDLVLESATGDSMVQIFRHAHGEATACLRCLHREDAAQEGPSYLVRMSALTGLSPERLRAGLEDADDRLADEDIGAVAPGVLEIAEKHVGRDVCGFLSDVERLLPAAADLPLVSVAFTSYLAGVFLAGELVKASVGLRSPLIGRYQIDPLATLRPGKPFIQRPDRRCFCQQREAIVAAIRAKRSAGHFA
ncbi:MAG: hypothetical protein QOJ81_1494 [Chloroflexota bacterium]|nr:hypothetical protein [Chloroflexota bacterium]